MGRPPIPQDVWEKFDYLHGQRSYTIKAAAREVGIGYTSAQAHVKRMRLDGNAYKQRRKESTIPPPREHSKLSAPAKRSLTDFPYFMKRYFGLTAMPWQVDAAENIVKLLATDDEEYVVINAPPGSGKSTTFTQFIPCWLIARDRSVRIQIGSKALSRAKDYSRRIKRELERRLPVQDAESSLAVDFGRFKPEVPELWQAGEFIVEQVDGTSVEEKEPTVTTISQDADFLGARAGYVIWDDLVDTKNSRTIEQREQLFDFWQTMAESRLEPSGVIVLQGQRIGPDDLFHSALEMLAGEGEDDAEEIELPRKYKHIVYPAHDELACDGEHDRGARPQLKGGCLLDPRRLSWKKLTSIKTNDPHRYEVVYQQRETAPGMHLVLRDWIDGGKDPVSGEEWPGCLDKDRDWWEVPKFSGQFLSIVTVDPSPTRYWAIQWWLYIHDTEERVLVVNYRQKMGADQFLDRDAQGDYMGHFVDIVDRAKELNVPISHLIFERNAAQRFVSQYQFFMAFLRLHGIFLINHNTHSNKNDEQYGVQTIGAHYRHGKVRLPYVKPYGLRISQYLIDEVTTWPDSANDDQVMAHWFLEWNLPKLRFKDRAPKRRKIPSWSRGTPKRFLSSTYSVSA
jgi:hypothetical protein